jgi:nickel-type superoxide dismutase maturation protease
VKWFGIKQAELLPTLPDSQGIDLILWLLRRRMRLRVTGFSMLPTLQPGEEVLVNCHAYVNTLPQLGDIVLTQHPQQTQVKIIKRIVAIAECGGCLLQGDNPAESTDSRQWGAIAPGKILGKVVCRFQ